MSFIVGNKLQKKVIFKYSISSIYGIGLYNAELLRKKTGFGLDSRGKDITEEHAGFLEELIKNSSLIINLDLYRLNQKNIRQLCEISTYRGTRHRKGLPVRGQRTHTNAKDRPIFKINAK